MVLLNAGIREHDIELALFLLDLCEEATQIGKIRHISLRRSRFRLFLSVRRQFLFAAPGNENLGAFSDETFCGRKTYAAIAANNNCYLFCKLAQVFLFRSLFFHVRCNCQRLLSGA
jgi:hypothetical protein